MNKENSNFHDWYEALKSYARKKGGSAADVDAWREDYEAGKSVEQAWFDAWGE
ncbi:MULTISPECIES: hypothetical protein [Aquitalea]|uniref:hypothetical protein n=1 Tax=Aquitalea TaxID=407217 RepID=UPI0018EABC2F|nr:MULTISPECIES: hypothetical protein [Aquitalea]